MNISTTDLDIVAAMHISPKISDAALRKPLTQFHFFRDKVQLFYDFDKNSIILDRNSQGEITGILIFTYNEKKFNEFAGPGHLRFYSRVLKTIFGFYGLRFHKFFTAAKSMLGKNSVKEQQTQENFAKIWVLLVMEECRRQGIADSLLQKCIQEIKKIDGKILQVTVKKDNAPAIKAYNKKGFSITGSCMESSGESHIMQKNLITEQN